MKKSPYANQTTAKRTRSKKVVINDIKFDSQTEAKYYLFIKQQKRKGIVRSFEMQKSFELQEKFNHPTEKRKDGKPRTFSSIVYTPDFIVKYKDGSVRYVDVKGTKNNDMNRDFKLRAKLFMFKYNVPVYVAYLDARTGIFIENPL